MGKEISCLLEMARDMMDDIGLAENTKKLYEHSVFGPIIRKYEEMQIKEYSSDIMDSLMVKYYEQYEGGEITKPIFNWRKRGILILNDLYRNGSNIEWRRYHPHEAKDIPVIFQKVFNDFVNFLVGLSDSTKDRITGNIKRFLTFLSSNGFSSLDEVTADTIRLYLDNEYTMHSGSMDSVVYSLRKFFKFLEKDGQDIHRIWLFLAFPATIKRAKPAFSQDEVSMILEAVDTSVAPGKRDLAILAIDATTGLRAIDIINLKLSDIRWKDCELRISQHKTGNPLTLPLKKSVMDILADYILNERPASDSQNIFLTVRAPHNPFCSSSSLMGIINKHIRAAGIERTPDDGRTFHGLRRSLGTGIVRGGGSTTMAAQVLGHKGIAPTKQYIDIDMDGLRKCILPMSTIGGDVS